MIQSILFLGNGEKYLSEGEIESDTEQESKTQARPTNALTNLLGCYASDSDDAGTIKFQVLTLPLQIWSYCYSY